MRHPSQREKRYENFSSILSISLRDTALLSESRSSLFFVMSRKILLASFLAFQKPLALPVEPDV